MTILGIDPGLATVGYAVISVENNKIEILICSHISTSPKLTLEIRLLEIYQELEKIYKKFNPDYVALEEIFFAKNTKTALKVGQAQGIITLLAMQKKKTLLKFTPLQVKQTITGYGQASKEQIQKMLKLLLKLEVIPKPDDAADALAIAICASRVLKNKRI